MLHSNCQPKSLQLIRRYLAVTVLDQFTGRISDLCTLKKRIGKHRDLIASSGPQEHLKTQIVGDIILRLMQKSTLLFLALRASFKKELESQFNSFYALAVANPTKAAALQRLKQVTAALRERSREVQNLLDTTQMLKLS